MNLGGERADWNFVYAAYISVIYENLIVFTKEDLQSSQTSQFTECLIRYRTD